jgi:hypothetical protein
MIPVLTKKRTDEIGAMHTNIDNSPIDSRGLFLKMVNLFRARSVWELQWRGFLMHAKIGLWIDHKQAFVVYLSTVDVSTKTILSNVERHTKTSGGSRSATPCGPQDIIAENRILRKYKHHLDQYYEEVVPAVIGAKSIIFMGPGEAKGEFKTPRGHRYSFYWVNGVMGNLIWIRVPFLGWDWICIRPRSN